MENMESKSISQELKELYKADQEDRENWANGGTDWEVVKPRDEARLKRVTELYGQGLLRTGEDMFYAGMIFQHGNSPESYKIAMELSKKSWELGNPDGKWLYPRAEDRYLQSIGKPQIWGTQYTRHTAEEPWRLIEPFDKEAKTNEEREEMGIDIEAKLKKLNSQ